MDRAHRRLRRGNVSTAADLMRDPQHDWHPVGASAALAAGATQAASLLGRELVLWRDAEGRCHAWDERCPHRGARLSLGRVDGANLVCRYHAWAFDGSSAACVQVPAQPDSPLPAAAARAYAVCEAYGLIWACIGRPQHGAPPPFPEYANEHLRKHVCGPYVLEASGPRIVENFVDMAHFGTVHDGILGSAAQLQVCRYDVGDFDVGDGSQGLIATRCMAWQPQPNSVAAQGSEVEYTYRIVRPLSAMLTKLPQQQSGFIEAIALFVQPLGEERSQVWLVLAVTDFAQTDEELSAFQDRIFEQDIGILENQLPKRLPLHPRAEVSVACDRMSLAYRDYLRQLDWRYGVLPASVAPDADTAS